jgi:glycosyltransferase involved in cell wall biosynthesis
MISLIIPSYRNPECLDICLKSAIENQKNKNQIIVAIDGFIEESQEVLNKYKDNIFLLNLGTNQGMQQALNLGVMNATNERICIINDDNVLCKDWDVAIMEGLKENEVITINQIEPYEGIFNFPVKDFGTNPKEFDYNGFLSYEPTIRNNKNTPFICDWDFFLKLELNNKVFKRIHNAHFYHFVSMATKKGKTKESFIASENPAAQTYMYKWGIPPRLHENNSHNPKNNTLVKGIKFE